MPTHVNCSVRNISMADMNVELSLVALTIFVNAVYPWPLVRCRDCPHACHAMLMAGKEQTGMDIDAEALPLDGRIDDLTD